MTDPPSICQPGLTPRSFLVFVAVLCATMLWVLRTELLTGSYATGGTPPAVCVGWLMLLGAAAVTVGRVWWPLRLSRSELFVVYACLALAVPIASYGIMRAFLPHLTVLDYFAQPTNRFAEFRQMLPQWQYVTDSEIVRQCFEASPNERVPWRPWIPVLGRWFLFFLALFMAIMGMLTLFRRRWVDADHLQFPILYLPVHIIPAAGRGISLFANPIFYIGFTVAFLFNLTNVLRAFNPGFPALGTVTDLGRMLTESPWSAARPLHWYHYPQVAGLCYLVNSEVLFSVWFFFLLNKLVAVAARAVGYDDPNMPYMAEQCSGGYPMMALVLVFLARREITSTLLQARGPGRNTRDNNEPLPPWGVLLALLGGLAFVLAWCSLSGMNLALALIFVSLVLCYALVYARIRAEIGIPYSQLYPVDYPLKSLELYLGGKSLRAFGPERNVVLLGTLSWLSYHYYPEFMAAYQMEGIRLADDAHVHRRNMALALTIALTVGFCAAAWVHLTAYYQYGQNVVDGGSGLGDWRSRVVVQEFEEIERLLRDMTRPDWRRAGFALAGALVTVSLAGLRFLWPRFPFHPLGYLVATAYWNDCPVWGDLLLIWAVKSLILRIGGVRLYRQLIPCFIGMTIGQFFWGGLVWGNITPFIPPEIAQRYWLARV